MAVFSVVNRHPYKSLSQSSLLNVPNRCYLCIDTIPSRSLNFKLIKPSWLLVTWKMLQEFKHLCGSSLDLLTCTREIIIPLFSFFFHAYVATEIEILTCALLILNKLEVKMPSGGFLLLLFVCFVVFVCLFAFTFSTVPFSLDVISLYLVLGVLLVLNIPRIISNFKYYMESHYTRVWMAISWTRITVKILRCLIS